MTELIKNKEDLVSYLTTKKICSKYPPKSVMVTTKLRKEVLTDELQGKFIHNGLVRDLCFEGIGGGVYKAYIKIKGNNDYF